MGDTMVLQVVAVPMLKDLNDSASVVAVFVLRVRRPDGSEEDSEQFLYRLLASVSR